MAKDFYRYPMFSNHNQFRTWLADPRFEATVLSLLLVFLLVWLKSCKREPVCGHFFMLWRIITLCVQLPEAPDLRETPSASSPGKTDHRGSCLTLRPNKLRQENASGCFCCGRRTSSLVGLVRRRTNPRRPGPGTRFSMSDSPSGREAVKVGRDVRVPRTSAFLARTRNTQRHADMVHALCSPSPDRPRGTSSPRDLEHSCGGASASKMYSSCEGGERVGPCGDSTFP